MKATEILEKISNVLQLSETEQVKLESMKLENGTTIEADSFESGKEVFIVTEDERVALPEGEYELEDGRVLTVVEEGIIDALSTMEEETTPEEEAQVEELDKDVEVYVSKEEFAQLVSAVSELAQKVEGMIPKEEMSEEEEVKEEPKEELSKEVELSSVDSFKHSPEKESKDVEGFKLSTKRQPSTLDNVLQFLNK